MNRTTGLSLARLGFGLLGLSAVVTEIATLVERSVFTWYNFFGYFTIQSNLAVALFLIVYAAFGRTDPARSSLPIQAVRGGLTRRTGGAGRPRFYIGMTGIIFSVLLAGLPGVILTAAPWDNIVLHYIMPIVVIIDWLVDPPAVRLDRRIIVIWMIYPVGYATWAIIRGLIDAWYPYPFLDAGTLGYPMVALTIVILAAAAIGAGWLLAAIPLRSPIRLRSR